MIQLFNINNHIIDTSEFSNMLHDDIVIEYEKKIADYVALTQRTGGSEYWWNTWCDYVAGNRANKSLSTGDEVSMFHVVAVIG